MKLSHHNLHLSAVSLAILSLMVSGHVRADDEEVRELTQPVSTIELGVTHASGATAASGEYSGLNKSGNDFLGNMDIRGGNAYRRNEEGGTYRWSVRGSNLGLSSRNLEAQAADQGRWSLGVGYDELTHSLTDSYQTPYQGAVGDNQFMLPAGFGTVANTATGLTAGQLAVFRNLDIGTTRKNRSLSGSFVVNGQSSLNFDYNRLDQSGAKLMGYGSTANSAASVSGEVVSILPMPTNYTTDTVNVAWNWLADGKNLTVGYHGSYFRDGYRSVEFQTFGGANATQLMPTAPDNDLHQIQLAGGYKLSPLTKLTANLSYGRNSQNVDFVARDPGSIPAVTSYVVPSSAQGLIVTTHADARLTHQYSKNLSIGAAIKHDERDNQTPSNIYDFNAISGGNRASYPNAPLSTRKTQMEVSGDYKFGSGRSVRLAYQHDDLSRWCNQYATGGGVFVSANNYTSPYAAGTSCVVAKSQTEDKLEATYKVRVDDGVDWKLGYSLSDRNTSTDPYARTPMIGTNGYVGALLASAFPTTAGTAVTTNPAAPVGQNGGDFYGFYPYFSASRKQNAIKTHVNLQAGDAWAFGLGGKYTDDRYGDSAYGVQNGSSWSLNLDSSYAYSSSGTAYFYLTKQYRQRELRDYLVSSRSTGTPAVTTVSVVDWNNRLTDRDVTLGLGFQQDGLMSGKISLQGDLSYILGQSTYGTTFGKAQTYAYNTATPTTTPVPATTYTDCTAAANMTCGTLPDIRTEVKQLKLVSTYQVDKERKVVVGYLRRLMNASDYFYNGYQLGNTPTSLMPTNQQAPVFSMNVISASFIQSFR